MKKLFFSVLFFAVALTVNAQLVISQVYGGGGNSGATYKNDFIELFNPTSSPVSLAGWSLQYASASGTTWTKTDLNGTVPAHGYYLVQQAQGAGGTENLPVPDAIGTIAMSGTSGKVVLVNNNTLISSGTSCPSGIHVVDIVGYGSANCFHGAGATATLSNTTAAIRKNNGCTNSNDNAVDFATGTPTPRNSVAASNNCTTPPCTPLTHQPTALNLSATATTINGSFTAAASGTTGTDKYLVLLSSTATLSQQPANGNAYTAGSSLGNALVVSSDNSTSFILADLSASTTYYIYVYSYTQTNCYNLTSPLTGFITTEAGTTTKPGIVINEVYGGGGNNSSFYKNDFIELYNNESFAVNLSGWSVQYASSSGTTWQVTPLNGTIPAKGYYQVQQAAGSGGEAGLPVPDAIGNIAMSSTNGKIALVDNTTALSGSCPGAAIIDLVGYGSANCFEGTVAAGATNTASLERKVHGFDTDDNYADFEPRNPEPQNTGYTTTAPQVTANTPADDATNLSVSSTTTISFDKPVSKGTGSIKIYENNILWRTISVSATDISVTDKTVTINVTYNYQSAYHILVDAGAFTDQYGNAFAGISQSTAWNFTTSALLVTAPAAFNFQDCSSALSDGFSKINITGGQQWGCTAFGNNSSNGVQINGFVSGAAQTNDAWLISPAISLAAITNIPVLSFYSRGDFSGPKLQVYISTSYTGTGVPDPAAWTEITNANISNPSGTATGSWTLADDIDLSAYSTAEKIYIAFRYTSSPAAGAARWAVDDISITDRSVLVNASPSVVNFGEVASGQYAEGVKITVNAITGAGISLTTSTGYELSADNINFSSAPLLIDQATAMNGFDVFVRFSPASKQLKFDGTLTIASGDFNKNIVALSGSSYLKSETFDVGTYNISFFGAGSTNSFTEQQRATQVANVTSVFEKLNLDVIGVEEVSHDDAFNQLVSNLPGYAGVLSHRWSYSFDAPDPNFPPQKIGFVYNSQTMTLSATEPPRAMFESLYDSARLGLTGHRLLNYPTGNPASFWGSGRLPYMATFITSINGVNKKVRVIVIHAKSGSSVSDFNRRLYDVKMLKDSIDAMYADDNVILVGDYNDRVIKSIYTGSSTSSFNNFVNDAAGYAILTYPLDVAGRSSFPSSNGLIDHIAISNELESEYIEHSTDIEDPRTYISGYNSVSGSDHLPVYSRFQLKACSYTVAVPDVPAITGGAVNTLYTGYGPSTVSLYGSVSGETAPYSYSWTTGTTAGPVISNEASVQVNPAASTTYVLRVQDKNGCYAPAITKTIIVEDVRCGNKMDKVMVCRENNGKQKILCVDDADARELLGKGASLGACLVSPVLTQALPVDFSESILFSLSVSPNPSPGVFRVRVHSNDPGTPIRLKVTDMLGRVMETRQNIVANSIIELGNPYKAGIYMIELVQGDQRKQLKVMKQ